MGLERIEPEETVGQGQAGYTRPRAIQSNENTYISALLRLWFWGVLYSLGTIRPVQKMRPSYPISNINASEKESTISCWLEFLTNT